MRVKTLIHIEKTILILSLSKDENAPAPSDLTIGKGIPYMPFRRGVGYGWKLFSGDC